MTRPPPPTHTVQLGIRCYPRYHFTIIGHFFSGTVKATLTGLA